MAKTVEDGKRRVGPSLVVKDNIGAGDFNFEAEALDFARYYGADWQEVAAANLESEVEGANLSDGDIDNDGGAPVEIETSTVPPNVTTEPQQLVIAAREVQSAVDPAQQAEEIVQPTSPAAAVADEMTTPAPTQLRPPTNVERTNIEEVSSSQTTSEAKFGPDGAQGQSAQPTPSAPPTTAEVVPAGAAAAEATLWPQTVESLRDENTKNSKEEAARPRALSSEMPHVTTPVTERPQMRDEPPVADSGDSTAEQSPTNAVLTSSGTPSAAITLSPKGKEPSVPKLMIPAHRGEEGSIHQATHGTEAPRVVQTDRPGYGPASARAGGQTWRTEAASLRSAGRGPRDMMAAFRRRLEVARTLEGPTATVHRTYGSFVRSTTQQSPFVTSGLFSGAASPRGYTPKSWALDPLAEDTEEQGISSAGAQVVRGGGGRGPRSCLPCITICDGEYGRAPSGVQAAI